jgi:hypothetical protein
MNADAAADIMRKHLPPSGARLHLADVGGRVWAAMAQARADLDVLTPADAGALAALAPGAVDAVTALEPLTPALMAASLAALRPGGRMIVADAHALAGPEWVARLEAAGFVRVLVEALPGGGALLRGEHPHAEADTLARIDVVARPDAMREALAAFRGRYLHVLVRQSPNKPVWALAPGEGYTWRAVAVVRAGAAQVLAFSSLPSAVAFMQRAVLAGQIPGVNKVAKFSRETAQAWPFGVWLNPTLAEVQGAAVAEHPLDPATAVTGDE